MNVSSPTSTDNGELTGVEQLPAKTWRSKFNSASAKPLNACQFAPRSYFIRSAATDKSSTLRRELFAFAYLGGITRALCTGDALRKSAKCKNRDGGIDRSTNFRSTSRKRRQSRPCAGGRDVNITAAREQIYLFNTVTIVSCYLGPGIYGATSFLRFLRASAARALIADLIYDLVGARSGPALRLTCIIEWAVISDD
ncbi:hypothetical protein GEV33_011770 [Tenebrio molitor]|jgi:hypothetical protein|uniref:Uncharacterized protein n=1 Tax=Tenebrio molitor TaxID=7067 RepID=A0A8J6HAC8_TENMO|nr:hypothetical protein GEV33_011770 [Tenebrio molitor]